MYRCKSRERGGNVNGSGFTTNVIVDRFGSLIEGQYGTNPQRAANLLLTGFRAKRFQTRHLPERAQLSGARVGARVALESVTNALEHPGETVLTSIFLPTEIFHAMGLRPLVAEALADFICATHAENGLVEEAEQRGVPETYCSFHKVLLGAAATKVLAAPRLIANCSVACDANNTTFRWLGQELGSPHVYVDVPYSYDEDACAYVADQLRELAATCEQTFGRTLDEDQLRERVARSQVTLDAMVRTLPRRRGRYLANDMGLEMQTALALHPSLGERDVERMATRMLDDLAHARHFEGSSLVWGHLAPFFSPGLQAMIDTNPHAQIVASDMSFDQASLARLVREGKGGTWHYDAMRPAWDHDASDPWLAMAERLIKNTFNGPATRRIERLRTLAEVTDADGVVLFCHWGCKETMGASQLAKRELEAAGIPTLTLDGDGCHRSNNPEGQSATRMGAFLEMLEARRGEVA